MASRGAMSVSQTMMLTDDRRMNFVRTEGVLYSSGLITEPEDQKL